MTVNDALFCTRKELEYLLGSRELSSRLIKDGVLRPAYPGSRGKSAFFSKKEVYGVINKLETGELLSKTKI